MIELKERGNRDGSVGLAFGELAGMPMAGLYAAMAPLVTRLLPKCRQRDNSKFGPCLKMGNCNYLSDRIGKVRLMEVL